MRGQKGFSLRSNKRKDGIAEAPICSLTSTIQCFSICFSERSVSPTEDITQEGSSSYLAGHAFIMSLLMLHLKLRITCLFVFQILKG